MAHDIFISYSSNDKLTADAICSIFESNGIRCWIAPRDILPGMDWGESIIDAINNSQVMVLILSSSSNASDQVKREVERAVHKSIVIIPFRIEDVQLSKSLEYQLSLTHWMDALTPPLESHIQLLVDEIKPLLLARQTENSFSEQQQFSHVKVASEKVVLEKAKDLPKPENKVTTDSSDAIETYFYDLAKEKRISKDILMAVLALLDKEQSQLSPLEQQQCALVKDLFESKFGALDFVRKWDKLVYEIEHAEKTTGEAEARKQQDQERVIQQKKAEEKAGQEKWQREPVKQKFQSDDSAQKKSRQESLLALGVFFVVLIVILIAGFIWYNNSQENPASDSTRPASEIETATDTAPPTTPTTPTALWGSLAIDSNQGSSYGYSYNYPTAEKADARALQECGSNCYIVKNFNGGCAAYAADQAPGGAAWGWGTAPSKEQAQELALNYCRQYGGTQCIVRVWSCNSG